MADQTVIGGSVAEIATQLDQFLDAELDEIMVVLEPNTAAGIEQFFEVLSALG